VIIPVLTPDVNGQFSDSGLATVWSVGSNLLTTNSRKDQSNSYATIVTNSKSNLDLHTGSNVYITGNDSSCLVQGSEVSCGKLNIQLDGA